MSLKEYRTSINGTETTLLLNERDAQARGLLSVAEQAPKDPAEPAAQKAAPAPANKARAARTA